MANCDKGRPRSEEELTTWALGAGRIIEDRMEESLGAGVLLFKCADAQDPRALGPDLAARSEVIAVAQVSNLSLDREGATMDLD